MTLNKWYISALFFCLDLIFIIPVFIASLISRAVAKPVDIGLGPEPFINNIYFKKALEKYGFTAQTFVSDVYYITDDFDIRADRKFPFPLNPLRYYYLFFVSIFKFKCLYIYFTGGPLHPTVILSAIEPALYKIAKVRIVVMPYGGDVYNLANTGNLLLKNAMGLDYPDHRFKRKRIVRNLDLWTKHADHIISGCDWVDYTYYWDTLTLGHFAIDTDALKPAHQNSSRPMSDRPIKILMAPNHPKIKGTEYFVKSIEDLTREGYQIELKILKGVPNNLIIDAIRSSDIIADQLIIGWYAMFALEAMALEKPVLCHIRNDLEEFYCNTGLLEPGELPIVNCNPADVKEKIRMLVQDKKTLMDIGIRSRKYVEKHHSLEVIGKIFFRINISLGIPDQRHDVS